MRVKEKEKTVWEQSEDASQGAEIFVTQAHWQVKVSHEAIQ
jgi:hypothetical protein